MELPKSFVILSTSSLIRHDPEMRNRIIRMMQVLASFLQENNLTTRTLLKTGEDVGESLDITAGDVTEEGMEVIRLGLDRWLGSIVDKGKELTNTRILERALAKVRGKKD